MRSPSPRHRRPLTLQPLEDRACPATFSYAADTATLTLTAADKEVLNVQAILAQPLGYIKVVEMNSKTTVFNSNIDQQAVRNLTAKFGNAQIGELWLSPGASLSGRVSIAGAKSSMLAEIDCSIDGSVTYTSGSPAATDDVRFDNVVQIGGNVLLNLGAGANYVTFNEGYVAGNLAVTGGAGFDQILFGVGAWPITIGGAATFALGDGWNQMISNGNQVHVGRSFRYLGGAGNDTVNLNLSAKPDELTVGGDAIFRLGPTGSTGKNQLEFEALTVSGALTIAGGAGSDVVAFLGGMHVGRDMRVALGGGPNDYFQGGKLTSNSIIGSFNYLGGSSRDRVIVDNLTVWKQAVINLGQSIWPDQYLHTGLFGNGGFNVHQSLTVIGGAQKDDIELLRIRVGNALTVRAGGGDDTVGICDASVSGATLIDLGAGADNLQLETMGQKLANSATFTGALTIRAGAGNDIVNLGSDNNVNTYLHCGSTINIQGGAGFDAFGHSTVNKFEKNVVMTDFEASLGPATP